MKRRPYVSKVRKLLFDYGYSANVYLSNRGTLIDLSNNPNKGPIIKLLEYEGYKLYSINPVFLPNTFEVTYESQR